jgi:hypothetical protein
VTGCSTQIDLSDLEEYIQSLTKRQAIAIAKYMTDRLEDMVPQSSLPEGKDQISALVTLFDEHQKNNFVGLDQEKALQPKDEESMGQAAKKFLSFLAVHKDLGLECQLKDWLMNPPTEQTAAIDSFTNPPVIMTGCFAVLSIICGTSYRNGKWEYDPVRGIDCIKAQIGALTDIVKSIIPFRLKKS